MAKTGLGSNEKRSLSHPNPRSLSRADEVTETIAWDHLEHVFCSQLGEGSDHEFLSLGQENDQAILAAEPTEAFAIDSPDLVDDSRARAAKADDLAFSQFREFTNTVHKGRFQRALQSGQRHAKCGDYQGSK